MFKIECLSYACRIIALESATVRQQFLVTYLLNDRVAIDAGSIGLLTDLRIEQVEHVFVTHQHIDHIATLPILLENVYEPDPKSIEVLSSKMFLIYCKKTYSMVGFGPTFALSTRGSISHYDPFRGRSACTSVRIGRNPVPVSHAVPTLGLIVDDGQAVVAFPSDTGPTEELGSTMD